MLFEEGEEFGERLRHLKAREEREKKVLAHSAVARGHGDAAPPNDPQGSRRRIGIGEHGSRIRVLGSWIGERGAEIGSGEWGAGDGEARSRTGCEHGRPRASPQAWDPATMLRTYPEPEGRAETGGAGLETQEGGDPWRLHRAETLNDEVFHPPPGSHTCGDALRRPRPGAEPAPPAHGSREDVAPIRAWEASGLMQRTLNTFRTSVTEPALLVVHCA